LSAAADGQIVDGVGNCAMAGNIAVNSVVALRLELIIGYPAQAGAAGVQGGRFLVQIGIGDVEHQAVGKTMIELGLECIGLRMAVVSVT